MVSWVVRRATLQDVGAMVLLTQELAEATRMPLKVDPSWAAKFIAGVISSPDLLALVADKNGSPEGMIVATIGYSSISPAPIAIEHGWYSRPIVNGAGWRLLARYEAWAKASGCALARMSVAHDSPLGAALVKRRGYVFAETALARIF